MPANPSFGKGGSPGRVADDPPRNKHTDKVARGGGPQGRVDGDPPAHKHTDGQTNRRTGIPSRPPFLNAPRDRKVLLGNPRPDIGTYINI